MVKIEFIQQLAELVKEKELEEITVSDGEETVTVKGRRCPPPPPPMGAPMPPMGMPLAQTPVTPVQTAQGESPAVSGNIVKAPLVGTFYAASAPDKPPFVTVGKRVKKGDVLMIIESMKLMNEVQSDFDGVVEEILVNNGQAVEYDQPIMIIK
ncbi:MAG: acetyl-CoA carboxylase biotin carboxyl carrier protein [Ruminococcus sp.]|nr:acetyl-CoA carboxylase biotin carboxyl carrier protein [Ruminococcus sp.]MCM1381462.1 acetyl-CoA carboxylase biotin carboxyl carrier protein [Muribaculaceae bacterium]MCM1478078.1 acetyl-CoA carboxylase biotin carboxyl carrier protein [Muribaculaceae bacterium]